MSKVNLSSITENIKTNGSLTKKAVEVVEQVAEQVAEQVTVPTTAVNTGPPDTVRVNDAPTSTGIMSMFSKLNSKYVYMVLVFGVCISLYYLWKWNNSKNLNSNSVIPSYVDTNVVPNANVELQQKLLELQQKI